MNFDKYKYWSRACQSPALYSGVQVSNISQTGRLIFINFCSSGRCVCVLFSLCSTALMVAGYGNVPDKDIITLGATTIKKLSWNRDDRRAPNEQVQRWWREIAGI